MTPLRPARSALRSLRLCAPPPPVLLAALIVALLTASEGAGERRKVDPVNAKRGVAIEGYDVVAYFEQQKPVKGAGDHVHEWRGAIWRFASAAHRDAFAADPERFAPQYGGYCAYAVSEGYTAGIDPDAFTVRDGKLYLNYDLDVQEKWRAEAERRIRQADRHWPTLHR